jgi:predicted membrane-bound spermidine synthase
MTFLFVTLFVLSMSVLLFELTLTRLFSIVLWYDYAFMAISVAFFGLGIGALLVHILKGKLLREKLPTKILQSTVAFAISVPIFLLLIGHVIPSSTSYLYMFYLASSIPFFFAGISMALIYLAMPREISTLYFVDLIGAATATLILDTLMRSLGAESVLVAIDQFVIGPSLVVALLFLPSQGKKVANDPLAIENKTKVYALIALAISGVLLTANVGFNILSIQPGEVKGLHYQLINPSAFKHLSTQWNSFSRIDVTKQMHYQNTGNADNTGRSRTLAAIVIDADADTPIFRWNGSIADIQWLKQYMDYMPFEISSANNNTLVIGGGGGEDILVALAGGAKNVTAVELNPLIISAAKRFGGSLAGNLYDRKDVHLFIDDGRRFISSTNSKYDKIVIKLVDSWAAQLAGGYALSENYLYTVEAFKQYLQHLNGDNGMLVMVRWNIELPRLMPLVVESLKQQEAKGAAAAAGGEGRTNSVQDISKQIVVVEDRPGLFFGSNDKRSVYPVIVMVKNSPFPNSELDLIKAKLARNDAKVIAMPGGYVQPPYDRLLLPVSNGSNKNHQQSQQLQQQQPQPSYDPQQLASFSLKPPTDDSPFYFAKEQIPNQMLLLLETVLGVSVVLGLLLAYYSRVNKIRLTSSSTSLFHIIFVICIGFGFIFLEITFIQKFLLLLGTPIMALTVILFSILLSSGIGAYLSGRLFNKNPYKAVVISIPILTGIVIFYYTFIQEIIDSAIVLSLYERIVLTFALLSPAGLLMGFQFPSITRMASSSLQERPRSNADDITLLWGVNVIASVIGTVLTAISSMVIGFSGNLLVGIALYLGALISAIAARKITYKLIGNQEIGSKS